MKRAGVPPGSNPILAQQLYLSPEGTLLETCDSVFYPASLVGQNFQALSPVFESCWQCFFQLENIAYWEYHLPGVHLEFEERKGIFDLTCLKIWYDQFEAVYLLLTDKTSHYRQVGEAQQHRNEHFLDQDPF